MAGCHVLLASSCLLGRNLADTCGKAAHGWAEAHRLIASGNQR